MKSKHNFFFKNKISPLLLQKLYALIDRSGWMQKKCGMFSLICGTSGEEGRFVNLTLKRGGVAFKDERGSAKRHCNSNDREKLLEDKDLKIFVAITEKSYFFFKFCVLISPDVPFNLDIGPGHLSDISTSKNCDVHRC